MNQSSHKKLKHQFYMHIHTWSEQFVTGIFLYKLKFWSPNLVPLKRLDCISRGFREEFCFRDRSDDSGAIRIK